jgi:hypothetical protein
MKQNAGWVLLFLATFVVTGCFDTDADSDQSDFEQGVQAIQGQRVDGFSATVVDRVSLNEVTVACDYEDDAPSIPSTVVNFSMLYDFLGKLRDQCFKQETFTVHLYDLVIRQAKLVDNEFNLTLSSGDTISMHENDGLHQGKLILNLGSKEYETTYMIQSSEVGQAQLD